MVLSMIKQYHAKGKNQASMIRKLKSISSQQVEKAASEYYHNAKTKFYTMLAKWFAKKKTIVIRLGVYKSRRIDRN